MARRSYKPKGPNRTDLAAEAIEEEMIEFWQSIGDSDVGGWQKPWIEHAFEGESAGKFINNDERYVFTGGFNQFLIAYHSQEKDHDKGPLIFNRSELTKIFEVDDFKETPIVQEGIKSIGSLYKAPVYTSTWSLPSGEPWKAEGKRRQPSEQEQIDLNLTEHKSPPKFGTFPVWSADDLYDHLPETAQKKIDNLIEIRTPEPTMSASLKESDWNGVVNDKINEITERQGLKVATGGNIAAYFPLDDKIKIPTEDQFDNPIARLAISFHEFAHSTMHLNKRPLTQSNDQVAYAKEELLAETTAVLMVKRFEKELEPFIKQDPVLEDLFEDYYRNAQSYNKHWGGKLDFDQLIDNIDAERESNKGVIKSLMVNISKTVNTLENGEFTPDQRLEAKNESLANYSDRVVEKRKESSNELTM